MNREKINLKGRGDRKAQYIPLIDLLVLILYFHIGGGGVEAEAGAEGGQGI